MRNLIRGMSLVTVLLVPLVSHAATPMFPVVGVTTAVASTCPTGSTIGVCSTGGWFRIAGAYSASVVVTATAGLNTVLLEWRPDSSGPTSTLYTWTDATATTVGRAIFPPTGEVRVRTTDVVTGPVFARIEANSMTGGRIW